MTVTQLIKRCPPYHPGVNWGTTSHRAGTAIVHLARHAFPAAKATAVAHSTRVWQLQCPHDNLWHGSLPQRRQHLELLTGRSFPLWLEALRAAVELSALLARVAVVVGVTGLACPALLQVQT